jgi:hypothetical protein
MKKLTVKKLRIGKETLLPLDSRQMREVAGGATAYLHIDQPGYETLYDHLGPALTTTA